MEKRPTAIEFLTEVLGEIEGLPAGLAERLAKLVAEVPEEERAEAIRRLIEEHAGD
jgi:hypothetical protein